jgi:hypothetical protein
MNELEVVDSVVCEARSSSGHHGKSSGESQQGGNKQNLNHKAHKLTW